MAEDLLWQALRGRKVAGLKFRRQQPVRGFVVDFYCEVLDLAIELDGSVHDDPAVKARDQKREAILRRAGLRFLRFKNHEVKTQLNEILQVIRNTPPPL